REGGICITNGRKGFDSDEHVPVVAKGYALIGKAVRIDFVCWGPGNAVSRTEIRGFGSGIVLPAREESASAKGHGPERGSTADGGAGPNHIRAGEGALKALSVGPDANKRGVGVESDGVEIAGDT